jgi:hypothetical protein
MEVYMYIRSLLGIAFALSFTLGYGAAQPSVSPPLSPKVMAAISLVTTGSAQELEARKQINRIDEQLLASIASRLSSDSFIRELLQDKRTKDHFRYAMVPLIRDAIDIFTDNNPATFICKAAQATASFRQRIEAINASQD